MTPHRPRKRYLPILLANLATVVFALPAHSAETQESEFALGAIGVVQRQPYRGIDSDNIVLPFATYENQWINIVGPGIDVKLATAGPLAFTLGARYAQEGYEAKDSSFLTGMTERKGGVWIGPKVTWEDGPTSLSAEFQQDASGNSKGQKFAIELEHGWRFGATGIAPRIAAVWVDKKYVNYYYGVTPAEARPGRPGYTAKATTNVEAGIRVMHTLAQRHTVLLDAGVNLLGKEAKDSPLLERKRASHVAVGYLYSF